jgi:NADH dehydrogenase (ubiquinone) Fe-S protein 1
VAALQSLINGESIFAQRLRNAKKPMVVIGSGVMKREDAGHVLSLVAELAKTVPLLQAEWNGVNILHHAAGRVAALDLGYQSSSSSAAPEVVFLLGADETAVPESAFVVYQGHTFDKGAENADVLLPATPYTEHDATYVNTEGRAQQTALVLDPIGETKEGWQILRALSEAAGVPLPYDSKDQLHQRLKDVAPALVQSVGELQPSSAFQELSLKTFAGLASSASPAPLTPALKDYYFTDAISRNSKAMALCSSEYTYGNPPQPMAMPVAQYMADLKTGAHAHLSQ